MPTMLFNKIELKKFDIYSFFLILLTFGIDRLSKIYVINLIESNQKELMVNDFLNLTLNWNRGIGFGLLSFDASMVYHAISALILLIIIYLIYIMVKSDDTGKIIISLIIGGALGNFYDRLNYFAVPDFIDFHINNFHWFTFNIADIFISIGIIFILLREIFFKKQSK